MASGFVKMGLHLHWSLSGRTSCLSVFSGMSPSFCIALEKAGRQEEGSDPRIRSVGGSPPSQGFHGGLQPVCLVRDIKS